MKLKCPACGEEIVVSDDMDNGQHVRCPYCGGKFAYGAARGGISEEELRIALEVGRKDPEKAAYYDNAPAGARLFIALVFYGTYFKDTLNVDGYMAAFDEIGPELKEPDLKYLLRFETDETMRKYLVDRLIALGVDVDQIGATPDRKPKLGVIRKSSERQEVDATQNPIKTARPLMAAENEPTVRARPDKGRGHAGAVTVIVAAVSVVLVAWFAYLTFNGAEPQGRTVVKVESTSAQSSGNDEIQKPESEASQEDGEREKALESFRAFLSREKDVVEGTLKETTVAFDEILNDQKKLSETLIRLEAENDKRSKAAVTNGWIRFDKAEMVMMILKDKDMNDLAIKYLGEDLSALRTECRGKIKAALDMQSATSKMLAENRARYRKQLEGIEEEVDRKATKAQEITLQANKDLEARLVDLEKARAKKELQLKRLKAIDRKSQWIVNEERAVQDEVYKLEKEISRVREIVAVSRGNVAHIAATAAETLARRKGDAALSSRQDDDNAVHSEMAHVRTIFNLATEYENRSLDKISASMRSRKDILSARAADAQRKLDFVLQSSANADLMRPAELESLRKRIADRIGEKVLDKLQ